MHLLLTAAVWTALSLTPVSEDALPEVIARHSGNVVLVNFWATWCSPCREEFPYLVRLQKDWGHQGVTVLTISMDEPEYEAEALDFLKAQGVDFPSYIRGFEDFEAFVDAIDPDWIGVLPATFIFDRQGVRVSSIVGKLSEEELRSRVLQLLH